MNGMERADTVRVLEETSVAARLGRSWKGAAEESDPGRVPRVTVCFVLSVLYGRCCRVAEDRDVHLTCAKSRVDEGQVRPGQVS